MDALAASREARPMGESIPAEIVAELSLSDRGAYFEQRLFVLSPLNTFWTALLIFVVLIGSFAVAATLSGIPLVDVDAHGIGVSVSARFALIFSLLITTVLGMQRFSPETSVKSSASSSATPPCATRRRSRRRKSGIA